MKRAVKIDIKDREVVGLLSEYTCPSCKVNCTCDINTNVTRFKCIHCDRELIINSRKRSNL